MQDEGATATCCLRATDEEYESDSEAFDCECCEYRLQQEQLGEHDITALRTYDLLQTSVVRDLKLTPLVFEALQLRMSPEEALLLLEKLDVIHESRPRPVDLGDAGER